MIDQTGSGTVAEGDLEARFAQAMEHCTVRGMSAARSVAHLIQAHFPIPLVRARFPNVAPGAFEPAVAGAHGRAAGQPWRHASNDAPEGGGSGQVATAQTLAARVQRALLAPAALGVLADGVSFQYVPLIQCSFPHADPGTQTHFTRRNGWLELTLSTTRPEAGLPYGVPARLLTMYCASEAIRTRSPEIFLGKTVHDFLRRLEVPITRGERGSLRAYTNQLMRLVSCSVSIDENIRDPSGRTGLHIRQALFVEDAQLWWDGPEGIGQGSSLILSSVLYDSILERSAPLSTAAIKQLRKSPMDLDVYAWLTHRLFHLSKPSSVTWLQLSGQFGHNYSLLRKFRTFFSESLQRVLQVYPEAKVKLTDSGVLLLPSRPHVARDALITRS